jgi:hypothetical protein
MYAPCRVAYLAVSAVDVTEVGEDRGRRDVDERTEYAKALEWAQATLTVLPPSRSTL